MTLTPDLIDLLERAAAHPRGLAFLHLGPVESVAVTLGVDARVVDRARETFDDPLQRAEMIDEFHHAMERIRSAGGLTARARLPIQTPPALAGPAELIDAAEAHPLGVEFLLEASPEAVAVIFGVHPFVVHEARELLARGGRAPQEQ